MLDLKILNTVELHEHIHTEIELIYVLEGCLCVDINDKSYYLNQNDMIIINSNNRHYLHKSNKSVDKTETLWYCRIHLKYDELLWDLSRDFVLFWCNSVVSDSSEYEMLAGILDEILNAWEMTQAGNYLKKSLYYKLVGCLAEHFLVTGMENQWSRKSNFERDELLQYINSNYYRPITLKEMAERLYMSETAFSKYFKKAAGMNFVQYMHNIRLHHAVEDILYTDKKITQIAVDNGFASPSFFNRIFKSAYYMTPTAFRETSKLKKERIVESDPKAYRAFVAGYLQKKSLEPESLRKIKYIQADVEQSEFVKNPWVKAMNLGEAHHILSAKQQQQIAAAKKDLNFQYGRLWNIFSWNMKFRENHSCSSIKFDTIDAVFDFLTDHGIIPMIDLGDRPGHAMKDCAETIYMEPKRKIFESLNEYKELLELFMKHIVHRYGISEVKQWIFEVWFDPGEGYESFVEVMEDYNYTEVFKVTVQTVKRFSAEILVGGAGMAPGNVHTPVRNFLEQCGCKKLEPDFISIYSFPYGHIDENDVLGSIITPHSEFIRREINSYRTMAVQYGFENVPLFITEWNMSLSSRTYYNDSCGKAALMLKNMVDNLDAAWLCAYGCLSDIDTDYFDSDRLLIGAGGLLSKEGIPKPGYYAMKFIAGMGEEVIALGDGYMITRNKNHSIMVLCFNYKAIGQLYYLKKESDFKIGELKGIFSDNFEMTFQMSLDHVSPGFWNLRRYRISPEYGGILGVWQQLNEDTSVRENVEYMKQACIPRLEVERVQCMETSLVLNETLAAHEIRLIVISR